MIVKQLVLWPVFLPLPPSSDDAMLSLAQCHLFAAKHLIEAHLICIFLFIFFHFCDILKVALVILIRCLSPDEMAHWKVAKWVCLNPTHCYCWLVH